MVVLDIFTCLQRFTLAAGDNLECKGRANPYSLLLAVSLPLRFHKAQISLQNFQRAVSTSDFTDPEGKKSPRVKEIPYFFPSFLGFCTCNLGDSSLLSGKLISHTQKLHLLLMC